MKVGDSVKLSSIGRHTFPSDKYNPHDCVGKLTTARSGDFYVSWDEGNNVYREAELEVVPKEKKMSLKSNFEIATTTETFRVNVLTLLALGYPIYETTLNAALARCKMGQFKSICRDEVSARGFVQRGQLNGGANSFTSLEDFLAFHFTPEKSKTQLEMEDLQVKMDEMQTKMNKLKETIDNE